MEMERLTLGAVRLFQAAIFSVAFGVFEPHCSIFVFPFLKPLHNLQRIAQPPLANGA